MNRDNDIKQCLDILRSGGTILYPTDTIWGIGCDATNPEAVERIYRIKKRETSKSLIVLVSDEAMLNRFVKDVPALAWDLNEMSEKPITIIYDQPRNIAANVLAEDGSCGIRIVRDEFCMSLIRKFGKPIVSTSANLSGTISPANFDGISEEIRQSVDYTVQWRQDDLSASPPSSIIRLHSNGEFTLIRK